MPVAGGMGARRCGRRGQRPRAAAVTGASSVTRAVTLTRMPNVTVGGLAAATFVTVYTGF
jgi:hypothetical protein